MRRDGMRSHFLSGNKRIGGRFIMCVCVCVGRFMCWVFALECFSEV